MALNADTLTVPDRARVILTGCCLSRSAGGPFESVSGLARALAGNTPTTVHVVGTYADPSEWPHDRTQWPAERLTAMPWRGLRSASSLRRAVCAVFAGSGSALVHGQGLWDASSVAMAMLAHETAVPLVVSPRGMLEPWALAHRRAKKTIAWHLWQKGVLQSAALLHATSAQEAASIRAIGLHNPIAVIPNGVGIPTMTEPALAPSRHAGQASRRCVYLSRIHKKKGLPLLLRAWSALRPPGWTLDIAGFGEEAYVAAIRALIRELDCPSIHFVGEKSGDAKAEFLKGAHLFVLPSYSENFGVAVAEAMAHAIPVVATHGTPWRVLADKRLGWWVPPTMETIRDALQEATRLAPDELHAMGTRARHYAAETFSWAGVARSMAACYNWIHRGGPLPDPILLDGMRLVT